MSYLIVWTDAEARANDLLRSLMRQVKYQWAWRKLNSARLHIIETHTRQIEDLDWRGERFVTNGEVEAPSR